MIVALNIDKENPLLLACKQLDKIFDKIPKHEKKLGRPKKYSDLQIIKCLIYKVQRRIFCLRELEWALSFDPLAREIIGLSDVPDYSTFSLRQQHIEKGLYHTIFNIAISFLKPDTRIFIIDSTPLKASKFDSEAKKGKSTRHGWFHGYKLHLIASVDNTPIAFKLTEGNVYDNNCTDLFEMIEDFHPFVLLGDAAYDAVKLFEKAKKLKFHLLTDINHRNGNGPESIENIERIKNFFFLTSPIGRKIYKSRIEIERLFAILKQLYNIENPRLYGFNRYFRHVSWALFLYLLDKLTAKNKGKKTNKFPWNQ